MRRRDTPEQSSAAAGSPETPNPALRGSNRPGVGSGVDFKVCVIHWKWIRGAAGCVVWCTAMRAARGGEPRRRGVFRGFQGYGPSKLAPKRQRGELMLTEGSGGRERGAGEVVGVKRWRVGTGFGERSMGRSSGSPGSQGSTSDGTAKPNKGLGRAEDH